MSSLHLEVTWDLYSRYSTDAQITLYFTGGESRIQTYESVRSQFYRLVLLITQPSPHVWAS